MATLRNKVQNALDEGRILILGSQILLGFHFRAVFETNFKHFPVPWQELHLLGLILILITFGLLVSPATYHCLVAEGNDSQGVIDYANQALKWALLPFAVGLGLNLFLIFRSIVGTYASAFAGGLAGVSALFFWYGLEWRGERKHYSRGPKKMSWHPLKNEPTSTEQKINHALTELRMVLPGAQAMLGFQFAIILNSTFLNMEWPWKLLHLFAVVFVLASIILLMTPAAYHRIVEEGEDSLRFYRFTSRILLTAMSLLGVGLGGDFFLVAFQITGSSLLAGILVALFWTFIATLWFGFTGYCRWRQKTIRVHHGAS